MNHQEIEIKFYVIDLKRQEARLLELGARLLQPRVLESNLRFDLPDRSLSSANKALRLRRAEDFRLTYKGPSESQTGVRTRTEIEFTVGDFESARQFIEALGYVPIAVYEKFRATYELDETHIMLDELPYGEFVEIEGPGADSIRSTATRLGLDWEAAVPASYLNLFERLCAGASTSFSISRPLDPTQLTFAALNGFKPSPEMMQVRPADR
jgi:adenylate cyclase class 2